MDAQLTLYGDRTGNCLRAAIALEESGLDFAVIRLSLRSGDHKAASYLALNPLGQVPILTIVQDNGPPSILTQSNAIVMYAAENAAEPDLVGQISGNHALVLERYFYFLTEVIALNHAGFRAKNAGKEDAARLFDEKAHDNLVYADRFVVETAFISGGSFSIADIAAYTIAHTYRDRLDWAAVPSLKSWYSRVSERPGIQRGMQSF